MNIDEKNVKQSIEQQQAILNHLSQEYDLTLDDQMGQLYNQFVVYISSAKIPMTHVLLVLELLKKDTIEQAYRKYVGEG